MLWTVNSPKVYLRLVVRCGWSTRAYELWPGNALEHALLAPGGDDAPCETARSVRARATARRTIQLPRIATDQSILADSLSDVWWGEAMTGEELARLVSGPFLAACALLAVAGTTKLARPATARDAARALHLPGNGGAVRALGAIELVVAVSGAFVGRWAALAVAGCYGLLTVTALALWRRAPGTPCGCLGTSPAPASVAHIALNAAAALLALVVATGPTPLSVLAEQPLHGIPFLMLTACATWLSALAMEALPTLRAAADEGSS